MEPTEQGIDDDYDDDVEVIYQPVHWIGSASVPSRARERTPAERCLGALNAYLGDRTGGAPVTGAAWLTAQKGWLLMTFASELHAGGADARGDRRDLFTCQDVGVGVEELRLFHLASSGHLTDEDVLVPAVCLATFMSVQDSFKTLPSELRYAVGYHVGFRAGLVNVQLQALFPDAEGVSASDFVPFAKHLLAELKEKPAREQQRLTEEFLPRCDRVEVPLRQVLGMVGHPWGNRVAWGHGE